MSTCGHLNAAVAADVGQSPDVCSGRVADVNALSRGDSVTVRNVECALAVGAAGKLGNQSDEFFSSATRGEGAGHHLQTVPQVAIKAPYAHAVLKCTVGQGYILARISEQASVEDAIGEDVIIKSYLLFNERPSFVMHNVSIASSAIVAEVAGESIA